MTDGQMAAHIERLQKVLRHLVNEVSGTIDLCGEVIRDEGGSTNLACLKRRLAEARAALDPAS